MQPGAAPHADPAVPSLARRLLSMLYEALLAFAIVFLAGIAFYGAAEGRLAGEMRLLFQLYLFLVLGIYFIACWSRGGRTLAMQTWKIPDVRFDSGLIRVARAALRYTPHWASLASFH